MQYFLLSSQSSGPIETHPVCSRASTPRTPLWTPTWYSWGLGYFSKSWWIPAAIQKLIGIGEDDRHGVCGSVWLSRERQGSAGHQRGLGRRRSVRWTSFRFGCVRQVRVQPNMMEKMLISSISASLILVKVIATLFGYFCQF